MMPRVGYVLQMHFARSCVGMDEFHVAQLAAALAELFDHGALIGFRDLNGELFIGFEDLVSIAVDDDFRLGDLQLVPFPPHLLDQDTKMQLPAAATRNLSALSVSCTRNDTLVSSSLKSDRANASR